MNSDDHVARLKIRFAEMVDQLAELEQEKKDARIAAKFREDERCEAAVQWSTWG
jgi:hypothetical protein|tara:strand:+ start:1227 stop:1388 length:162 start_codon:yes stop_codon:yes gene_type:complete